MLLSEPRDPARLWSSVLKQLQGCISEQKFNTWFRPMRPLEFTEERIVLEVPNPFFVDWFEEHNLPILKAGLEDTLGTAPEVQFVVSEQFHDRAQRRAPRPPNPRAAEPGSGQGGLRLDGRARNYNLNSRFTFESFVVGRGNEFARAACTAVAAGLGRAYNPLFLFGGTGLGKTHLMQAIGNEVSRRSAARICYVSAERFMNEMIESIQRGSTLDFRERYRGLDLLLIDDVQFLAGKESTQEEFFHTFNTLYDGGKQVVLTSDRAPRDLQDLEERLISRFSWGLVCDIQPPDLETRIAILRYKAEGDGIKLPDDVIFAMAEMIRTNVRELEGSLTRLQALADLSRSAITFDLMKDALSEYIRDAAVRALDVNEIQAEVAKQFDVPVESLRGKRRTNTLARARQVAMYLTKEHTTLTLVEIGRRFGNRDHSTVLHALSKIRTLRDQDPEMKALLERLDTILVGRTRQREDRTD
jgi:chromosomal replication initiator protein